MPYELQAEELRGFSQQYIVNVISSDGRCNLPFLVYVSSPRIVAAAQSSTLASPLPLYFLLINLFDLWLMFLNSILVQLMKDLEYVREEIA